MQRDDNALEKYYVLVPEWYGETTDDTCQNVKEFCSTIKFMVFVDKSEETLVNGLSNHFSSGDELGVELVEDVLEVVPFY